MIQTVHVPSDAEADAAERKIVAAGGHVSNRLPAPGGGFTIHFEHPRRIEIPRPHGQGVYPAAEGGKAEPDGDSQ